jgi:hypothetical protein
LAAAAARAWLFWAGDSRGSRTMRWQVSVKDMVHSVAGGTKILTLERPFLK